MSERCASPFAHTLRMWNFENITSISILINPTLLSCVLWTMACSGREPLELIHTEYAVKCPVAYRMVFCVTCFARHTHTFVCWLKVNKMMSYSIWHKTVVPVKVNGEAIRAQSTISHFYRIAIISEPCEWISTTRIKQKQKQKQIQMQIDRIIFTNEEKRAQIKLILLTGFFFHFFFVLLHFSIYTVIVMHARDKYK